MWSTQSDLPHRAGRACESDLSLRYLAPGAFTILPPGNDPPVDPLPTSNKHRLTPSTKKRRNAAFAIIAEPSSNSNSRSPSPSGRVSPFRGRGFNPAGSRHASPLPSPPPSERRLPPTKDNHQQIEGGESTTERPSKIPTLSRRGSAAALFEDKAANPKRSQPRTNLSKQYSQSLTNISPRIISEKPPPSPRRARKYTKPPAFQKLSPIIGSSPERTPNLQKIKNQSQSSPSKIPRSRSQPPSRRLSPNVSNAVTRVNSREPSPNRLGVSSTKVNYKNVKAKVNSYHSVKPKVPPKPQVPNENEQSLNRNGAISKSRIKNDNNNVNSKLRYSNNSNINNNKKKETTEAVTEIVKEDITIDKKSLKNVEKIKTVASDDGDDNDDDDDEIITVEDAIVTPTLFDLMQPSTTAVVSSTTTTVTQPLKIDAKFDLTSREDTDKSDVVYLPDARALSATSVSTAMNRMNDTVLDTRTIIKETNLSTKLPSTASSVACTTSNDEKKTQSQKVEVTVDARQVPSGLPPVEAVNGNNNSHNHNNSSHMENSHNTLVNSNHNESNGKNSVEHVTTGLTDALPKSAAEPRPMVATEVQPIRITVKEKPIDSDVQSGNVRFTTSVTNGTNERPGLPPSPPPNDDHREPPDPPKGLCGRFLARFKKKPENSKEKASGREKGKTGGGLMCCTGAKQDEIEEKMNRDANLIEEVTHSKPKWWEKTKCCNRNRVGDSGGCFPKKMKIDSIDGTPVKRSPKDACKNFFRWMFCLNWAASRRRRKEEEEAAKRRASIMSKKKSLTPQVVPEDPKSKLDAGLVEHTSIMKGAIPVLPVPLAWFCLILNVFLPGIGTILSGFLCLCIGKPRFSPRDGARPRIGACIIDFLIGLGQLFTVIFCLVGWGWSIWWGTIMLKLARKYRKIRRAEKAMEDDMSAAAANVNHSSRDVERGS